MVLSDNERDPNVVLDQVRCLYSAISKGSPLRSLHVDGLKNVAKCIGYGIAGTDVVEAKWVDEASTVGWDEVAQVAVRYFGPIMRIEIARVVFYLVQSSSRRADAWRRAVRVLSQLPRPSSSPSWMPSWAVRPPWDAYRNGAHTISFAIDLFKGKKPEGSWVSLSNPAVGMAWLLGKRYDLWEVEFERPHRSPYAPRMPTNVLLAFVQDETIDQFCAVVDHRAEWSTEGFLAQSLFECAIEYVQPKCARYVLNAISESAQQNSLSQAVYLTISHAKNSRGHMLMCNTECFAAQIRLLVELCPAIEQEIIDSTSLDDVRYGTSNLMDVLEIISGIPPMVQL